MEALWRGKAETPASSLAGLCRLFEGAARAHATALGLGVEHLHEAGRAWVLARLSLRVNHIPAAGDEVEVLTWPSRRTAGVRARRDFELLAPNGATLAEAESTWLVIDRSTHRPLRLPAWFSTFDYYPRDTSAPLLAWTLDAQAGGLLLHREVGEPDLDENRHVNNVTYVEWAMESLPPEVQSGWVARALDVEYAAEAFLGDRIIADVRFDPATGRLWQQFRLGDKPVARLASLWTRL